MKRLTLVSLFLRRRNEKEVFINFAIVGVMHCG